MVGLFIARYVMYIFIITVLYIHIFSVFLYLLGFLRSAIRIGVEFTPKTIIFEFEGQDPTNIPGAGGWGGVRYFQLPESRL